MVGGILLLFEQLFSYHDRSAFNPKPQPVFFALFAEHCLREVLVFRLVIGKGNDGTQGEKTIQRDTWFDGVAEKRRIITIHGIRRGNP